MPTGNAEKNNVIRNVRFLDLADAYRKKNTAHVEKPTVEKNVKSSMSEAVEKKVAKSDENENHHKKKSQRKPIYVNGFKDIKNESIDERKESQA